MSHWTNIQKAAKAHGLNPHLVNAVVTVESEHDTWAMRFEPGWRWWLRPSHWAAVVGVTKRTEIIAQACSWGLMQVMGTVARERGFKEDLPKLCRPDVGLDIGCKHLKWLLNRHGTVIRALSAYNTGRPETRKGKQYAAKVLARM